MTYLYADPVPSVLAQPGIVDTYRPGFLQTFPAAVAEGFRLTSVVSIIDTLRTAHLFDDGDDILTEKEWRASPHFRDGLKYYPGMTVSHAELLAERRDVKMERDFILSRGGTATIFAGFLTGGMADPINLIPFSAGFRGLKLLSAIGRGALENSLIEAALQPLLATQAAGFQENFDTRMALTNIFGAAALGGGFAGLGNTLARISPALRALATQKAVVDVANGRPVDVAAIVPERGGDTTPLRPDPLVDLELVPVAKIGRLEAPDEAEVRQLEQQVTALETEERLKPEDQEALKVVDEDAATDLKRADAYETAAICLAGP